MNNEYYTAFLNAIMPSLFVSGEGNESWALDGDLETMDEETHEIHCFELGVEVHSALPKINRIELEFDDPCPKKLDMADFLTRDGDAIVSEQIYNVLEPLKIKDTRLIPAVIQHKGKTYDNYHYLHNYNYISCLDKEKSVYNLDVLDMIETIDKMELDASVLSKIPLEERLIFRLEELFTFQLFHESVVEKIMAVNPTGIRFVKLEDYHIGSAFN